MVAALKRKNLSNRTEIFSFLRNYFITDLEISEDRIQPDTNLYQDLELDSIDAFNLAGMIEMELDLEISDADLKKIITIRDIVDQIEGQLAMIPNPLPQTGITAS